MPRALGFVVRIHEVRCSGVATILVLREDEAR